MTPELLESTSAAVLARVARPRSGFGLSGIAHPTTFRRSGDDSLGQGFLLAAIQACGENKRGESLIIRGLKMGGRSLVRPVSRSVSGLAVPERQERV